MPDGLRATHNEIIVALAALSALATTAASSRGDRHLPRLGDKREGLSQRERGCHHLLEHGGV